MSGFGSFPAWLRLAGLAALGAALLAGCASAPPERTAAAAPQGPVFYPEAPSLPRIQHLRTLTGERDMGQAVSDLAKFVAGDDGKARQLMQPYGARMFGGKLYVVDTKASGIAVFDLAANRFELFTGGPGGRMKRPINITIDRDGTKYVTDTGRNQVLVFDAADRFVTAFGREGEFKPVDTVISGDRLYVADIQHHQIQVLDKRSGKKLLSIGTAGSKPGELFHPTNLALGPDGDIYVVETSNFRIQRFTPQGQSVRTYGENGAELGTFTRPKGIAIDRQGRIFVGDSAFENVQIFDPDGRLLMFFGQPGKEREGLNLPAGVSIDYDSVPYFQSLADPRFRIEYLIFVVSQFGPNKVDVFGYGRMAGMDYAADEAAAQARAGANRAGASQP